MTGATSQARLLHVAALPFPTYQGTQAAIGSMLDACRQLQQDAQLFTYRSQAYSHDATRFTLHRVCGGSQTQSQLLRSGPSLGKMWLDLRMALQLRGLCKRLRPDVVVAHHVEAAALALSMRRQPVVFFAHTDLQAELPVHGPAVTRPGLARAGQHLDRVLSLQADAIAVISPSLLPRFQALAGPRADLGKVGYVPTPWRVRAAISVQERHSSRRALAVEDAALVALYAGNLDAYQGIDTLLHAFAQAYLHEPRLQLLIATESDPKALFAQAQRLGVRAKLRLANLAGANARRLVHAAADFAVVPRLSPGGLPIKLLDAMARGVPCATLPRACAGLPLADCVELAQRQDAQGLADAMLRLASSAARRLQLAALGRQYITQAHSLARFEQAFGHVLDYARAQRGLTAEDRP